MLVSGVQQSDIVIHTHVNIHTHVPILSEALFPFRLLHNMSQFLKSFLDVFKLFPNMNLCFFLVLIYLFYWMKITLQYCDGFCYTSTWIGHRHTCVPSLLNPRDSHFPLDPKNKEVVVHIHNGILLCYKKNGFGSVLMRWMNLEHFIQSEVS